MIDFDFQAELWLWKQSGSWHFITVPEEPSSAIRAFAPEAKRGFGSVRVNVQIGETQWQTSVFPDKASGNYFLPIKKAVRQAEKLSVGSTANVHLEVLM
ncbi:MAG: DUF1905 domain-containing protein [Pseudomonadota bacterium]